MLRNSYTTYKIIPDINIKNNHNETLAQAMAACFRAPLHRITNKGVMEVTKFYFDIELSQNKAEFYLTIPQNVEEDS